MKSYKLYRFCDKRLDYVEVSIFSSVRQLFSMSNVMVSVLLILILLMLMGSSEITASTTKDIKLERVKIPKIEKPMTFLDSLRHEIKKLKLKHPNIVFSQAILESGNFKSNIYTSNKNLFGMRKSGNRCTTAIGTNNGFAVYKNWRDSLLDYALFQSKNCYNMPKDRYLDFLNTRYSNDCNYNKKLALIEKRYSNE
jgi:flagellum-specific peptidoglycan hydrolase FlgJ